MSTEGLKVLGTTVAPINIPQNIFTIIVRETAQLEELADMMIYLEYKGGDNATVKVLGKITEVITDNPHMNPQSKVGYLNIVEIKKKGRLNYVGELDTYRANCRIIGVMKNDERTSLRLPMPTNIEVFKANKVIMEQFLTNDGISLGYYLNTDWAPKLDVFELKNVHTILPATTRWGKSWGMKTLAQLIHLYNINKEGLSPNKTLVFDHQNQMSATFGVELLEASKIEKINPRDIRIEDMEIFDLLLEIHGLYGFELKPLLTWDKDMFKASLINNLSRVLRDKGIINRQDFIDALVTTASSHFQVQRTIDAKVAYVRDLANSPSFNAKFERIEQRFSARFSLSEIEGLLEQGKLVYITLGYVKLRERQYWVQKILEYFLRKSQEEFEKELSDAINENRRPVDGKYNMTVVIDEVRHYAPEGEDVPCKDVLIEIAREGGKNGLGLICATQRTADIDKNVLSQINTWIVGGLETKTDKDHAEEKFGKKFLEELETLNRYEFLVAGKGSPMGNAPMPLRIFSNIDEVKKENPFLNEAGEHG